MTGQALTLYIGNKCYSSWSLRGWLALRHTGLPFTEVRLPLDTPEFYERLQAISPTLCVPTLVDGDMTVWDSLAIIDYCARLAPEKFWWPDDLKAYGLARSASAEMHSGFAALRTAMPMNIRGKFNKPGMTEAVEREVRRIDALWSECRSKYGSDGPFLFGTFSASDMMYAPVVSRFKTYNTDLSRPAAAYRDAVLDHPYMQEWITEARDETLVVAADELPADIKILGA